MKLVTIALVLTLLVAVGCSSSSQMTDSESGSVANADDTSNETGAFTPPVVDTEGTLIRLLADGLFVSAEELQTGENASGASATGHWTVEFGVDTIEWSHSDVVEVGTYTSDDISSRGTADFNGREIVFELIDGDLIWDSNEYLRTTSRLVDSQESLMSRLDKARYDSVEQFDVGENVTGELVMGSWSLEFDGDEVLWSVQDTISVGTYTYTGKASFQISFNDVDMTAYLLDNEELLFATAVYKNVFASQFDSQESLVTLLNGRTYQSLELLPVGGTITGAQALGYWYISFVQDTFTWDYQEVSEAGTYQYLDDDNFTAILPEREFSVAVEGDDIVFDGVRYRSNL